MYTHDRFKLVCQKLATPQLVSQYALAQDYHKAFDALDEIYHTDSKHLLGRPYSAPSFGRPRRVADFKVGTHRPYVGHRLAFYEGLILSRTLARLARICERERPSKKGPYYFHLGADG